MDAEWFRPNAWPAEVPELKPLVTEYLGLMRALSDELLELLASALELPEDHFTRHTSHPTWGFNVNRYPGTDTVGPPLPGQFRIGAHTDFGTVTVLDREQGAGGLQIHTDADGWQDAPYDPRALTVNIGDLMARWTGDRWRAGRHRVLPPPADTPSEELISLVYFYECDAHTRGVPARPDRPGGPRPGRLPRLPARQARRDQRHHPDRLTAPPSRALPGDARSDHRDRMADDGVEEVALRVVDRALGLRTPRRVRRPGQQSRRTRRPRRPWHRPAHPAAPGAARRASGPSATARRRPY